MHRSNDKPRLAKRHRQSTRWITAIGAAATFAAVAPPPCKADQTAYLLNVTLRPGYNFSNAQAALDYGYGLCDRIRDGQRYPQLMRLIESDFNTSDDYQASYLISQAAQELCPDMIWQLKQSAGGYHPPP